MDMLQSIQVSAGGMFAQSQRMKVAAQNIANADSVQADRGTDPYRAKQVVFKTVLDRQTGMSTVQAKVVEDRVTPFNVVYNPGSDLADARGFVQTPNVDSTMENINMREAQRSYEANMAAITTARDMATRTLDMLR
ncbi:MAG: flagellar basal body rod protein FlgC [Blastochloris viridis]|uniref:Flagellar basal-body rod protein FlgC n=1 Tax=Blastochloris viridis TaxID=1079 RepID=A0A6N4R6L0_BLAVI|nr:MAG: flagellar basal body rod protein FlgC [Blastochloris viridis]